MDWDQQCDISDYNIDDYINDNNNRNRFRKKEHTEINIKDSNENINEFSLFINAFYKCIGFVLCIRGFYYFRSFKKK